MTSFRKLKQRYHYSIILLKQLVRTDFKVRYQNSVLGYLWSLLRPLFMFAILYVIFVDFLHIGKGIPHWPIALFLGLVMWEFFNEVTKQGLKAVVSNGSLIRKINLPKYIIIISSSLSALINLLLNMIIVVVFIVLTNAPVGWGYLLIPVFILELYVFALGCSFLLSALYVNVRDINFIWEIVLRGGFYASAVLFPMSRIFSESVLAGKILLLNPVAQSIQDARHGMLGEFIPSTSSLMNHVLLTLVPFVIVLGMFAVGAWYFRRRSPYFAEKV
jgi:ABC-2 type transport system permease protein